MSVKITHELQPCLLIGLLSFLRSKVCSLRFNTIDLIDLGKNYRLIDNFISASYKMNEEERQHLLAEKRQRETISITLDPLLSMISAAFVDSSDLDSRLRNLFQVI